MAAERTAQQEAELKELLGEDYEDFVKFEASKQVKDLRARARTVANELVGEGGKFGDQWGRLQAQMDAIWDKAYEEAKSSVGLVEESEAAGKGK